MRIKLRLVREKDDHQCNESNQYIINSVGIYRGSENLVTLQLQTSTEDLISCFASHSAYVYTTSFLFVQPVLPARCNIVSGSSPTKLMAAGYRVHIARVDDQPQLLLDAQSAFVEVYAILSKM